MDLEQGQIVFSTAGHDKNRPFFVIAREGDFVLLANGKERKLAKPKRKRAKHVVAAASLHHSVIGKLHSGRPVPDSELRRALAALRDESGGYDAWQKTT